MKSRKLGFIAVSALTLGLVACGANDTNQSTGDNRVGTSGTGSRVGILGNDGNVGNRNFGQDRNGIDNNGPLTEDYDKEPGDLNLTGTRRNGNNIIYNNRGNGIDNDRADGDDVNLFGRNTNNENDKNEMNISSYKTNKSSKEYPHTKAILVREAKYQYVPIGKGDIKQRIEEIEQKVREKIPQQAAPNNEQQAAPNNEQQAAPKNEQQAAPNNAQQAPTTQKEPAAQPQETENQQQAPAAGISQIAQQVIDLTNEQRKQNGLPALQADAQLSGVAQKKSEDMRQNGYFSHTSPTYGSPFDMMRDNGISYKTAGENIAQGQPTPKEVVQAWMDSPGHRKNILSPDFTHIGIGYDQSGHHWTQMFIGK